MTPSEPSALEQSPTSTGHACLLQRASVHGVVIPVAAFTDADRSVWRDASSLAAFATRNGLPLAAERIGIGALRDVALPAIARGEDGEFFVIESLRDDGVVISEPPDFAPTALSLEAFTLRWSGVVLRETATNRVGSPSEAAPGAMEVPPARPARQAAVGVVVTTLLALGAIAWWASTRTVETTVWGTALVPPAPPSASISAPQAGTIRRVRLQDGDTVAAGDVLIELNFQTAAPEAVDPEAMLEAELDVARADAMLAALALDAPPRLRVTASVSPTRRASEERALTARYEEFRAKLGTLDTAIERGGAQRRAVDEAVASLREGLAAAQKRAAEARSLLDQGFISRNAFREREERVEQLQRDLDRQAELVAESAKAIAEATDARRTLVADARRTLENERAEAQQHLNALRAAAARPKQTDRVLEVRTEQAGVARLAERLRAGDTVAAGQMLASVQPLLRLAEIVALLDEKYAGQVRPGMPATLHRTGGDPSRTPLSARVVALAEEGGDGQAPNAGPRRVRATLRFDRAEQIGDWLEPGVQVMVRIAVGSRSLLASWFDR